MLIWGYAQTQRSAEMVLRIYAVHLLFYALKVSVKEFYILNSYFIVIQILIQYFRMPV